MWRARSPMADILIDYYLPDFYKGRGISALTLRYAAHREVPCEKHFNKNLVLYMRPIKYLFGALSECYYNKNESELLL
jgi:hypothetical protein